MNALKNIDQIKSDIACKRRYNWKSMIEYLIEEKSFDLIDKAVTDAMEEYAQEVSKGFARWLPYVGVEIRDGIYYTDLSGFDLDVEQDLFTQLFSLYQQSLKK